MVERDTNLETESFADLDAASVVIRSSSRSGRLLGGHVSIPAGEVKFTNTAPYRKVAEWAVVIIGAFLVAFLVKTFLFQAFFIPSESMISTLQIDDRVLVNKLSYDYGLGSPEAGDVIVFSRPGGEMFLGEDDLIKRVVAVPGQTVFSEEGFLTIDGVRISETYLPAEMQGTTHNFTEPILVPEGHVFTMGDNRGNSRDSRFFGPVPVDSIIGRAFVIVWPFPRASSL